MAGLQVGALNLTLRASAASRAGASVLQARAEQAFMPAVLGAMHRRLEEAFGSGAVIRIRRLRLRLSMLPGALDSGPMAETVGRDLAEQIEQMVPQLGATATVATAGAEVQVFRSRAHLHAAELAAAAARRKGPDRKARDFGRLWRQLTCRAMAEQIRVLSACAETGTLAQVLARLRTVDLPALARLVSEQALPEVVARALADSEARLAKAVSTGLQEVRTLDDAEPGVSALDTRPETRNQQAFVTRSEALERAVDEGAGVTASSSDTVPAEAPSSAVLRVARQTGSPPRAAAADTPLSESGAVDEGGQAAEPGRGLEPPPEVTDEPMSAASLPRAAATVAPGNSDALAAGCYVTQWGPLLYLLNISLQLELPERLWRIGVDEGRAMSAMLARLSGVEDDPVCGVLRADFPASVVSLPALPAWAQHELVEETEAAAERRALAPGLGARIDELRSWYATGLGWTMADWGAALHLAVVEDLLQARIGPKGLAERFLIRGQILVSETEIRVQLPMAAIDTELRCAGLDADPGWLAWLDKRLLFQFHEEET